MTKSIEEHIGEKVASLRKGMEWNQRELGEALEKATGHKWERQSVWAAEKGKRAWAVADLLGVAQVFNVTVAELVTTPEPLSVGGTVQTPEEIKRRTEGEAHLQGHWRTYIALEGLANVLRTVESTYTDTKKEVQQQMTTSPELADMVRERRDKVRAQLERSSIRDAAAEDQDVSSPGKLREYMDYWGFNSVPAIRAAYDVLEEEDNGK